MPNPTQRENHYQKPTITNGDFLAGILLGSALSMSDMPLLHKAGISLITANLYGQLENARTASIYAGEAVAGFLAWKFSSHPILRTVIPVSLMLPKLVDANKIYIAKTATDIANKVIESGSELVSITSEYVYDWANNLPKFLKELPDNDYLFQDCF